MTDMNMKNKKEEPNREKSRTCTPRQEENMQGEDTQKGIIQNKTERSRIKKIIRRICCAVLALALLAGIGFGVYVSDYYHADQTAESVEEQGLADGNIIPKQYWLELKVDEPITCATKVPKSTAEKTFDAIATCDRNELGFIFYPGGKVEYTAYLPLLDALRDKGVACYLVEMPCNLAFLGANRAEAIMKEHDKVKHWYIGGHSLGGAFASNFASKHADEIDGLILLGAYVYGDYPVEQSLTIYGSEDQVLNRDKITYSENVFEIPGGNHAGFGNYGAQAGDGKPTISSEEQQKKTEELIIKFMNQ